MLANLLSDLQYFKTEDAELLDRKKNLTIFYRVIRYLIGGAWGTFSQSNTTSESKGYSSCFPEALARDELG